MENIPILQDIVVIFAASVVVLFVCHRLRIPPIVGFLITGVIIGPSATGLVRSIHDVEVLAEIGVILLLFSIGIEFSFRNLMMVKKSVLLGGTLQVFITIAAAYGLVYSFVDGFNQALFIGFLMALSSTAIVLRTFQERAEIQSPHGRTGLAILIYQDMIIVPMIILTPFLAQTAGGMEQSITTLIIKAVVVVVLVILAAQYFVPKLLFLVTRTQSRELFLLSIVLIGIAVAWLTSQAGLSLGLGAFLAGLVISESEYSHQALEGVLPFRDVFTSFFFVSVGMLLDINFLIQNPILIIAAAIIVLVLKSAIAGGVALILGMSIRSAIIAGLSLGQVGEFSFILSKVGLKFDLIAPDIYQLFIAVSVITMGATPFIIAFAPRLADRVSQWPLFSSLTTGMNIDLKEAAGDIPDLEDHLIIVGYGINGRNLARAAKSAGINYRVIEMNPDTVRVERKKGEPIEYGDATNPATFRQAGIEKARIIVVAISDPTATRRVITLARRLNPTIHIIVRTRFVLEMQPLYELGADDVIPEEFETSIELFNLVLTKYLVPRDDIERFVSEIRADSYGMLRSLTRRTADLSDADRQLSGMDVCSLRLSKKSDLSGKSLADMDIRRQYGITVLAVVRDGQMTSNPPGSFVFEDDDLLYIMGTVDQIAEFRQVL